MRPWPPDAPHTDPTSGTDATSGDEIAGRPAFRARHVVEAREASGVVPHANNVAILGWIDRLAELHGDQAGASRASLARDGRMWFVARHEIDYLGETFVGDELELLTWVDKLGRTSLHRSSRVFLVRLGEPPRLVVRATSRWAMVALSTRRPVPIPEPVRQALTFGPTGDPAPSHPPPNENPPMKTHQ